MNKKVVIVVCAILSFFAGAIWVDIVPSVVSLVAFLEVAIGFGLGFLFSKYLIAEGEKNHKQIVSAYAGTEGKKIVRQKTPRERIAEVKELKKGKK